MRLLPQGGMVQHLGVKDPNRAIRLVRVGKAHLVGARGIGFELEPAERNFEDQLRRNKPQPPTIEDNGAMGHVSAQARVAGAGGKR